VSPGPFKLSGVDDQERNPTFVKTAFKVLKLKFLACSLKQALYRLYKRNIAPAWQQESTFIQALLSVPGCQTCMYKRGIKCIILVTNFQKSPTAGRSLPPAPLNLRYLKLRDLTRLWFLNWFWRKKTLKNHLWFKWRQSTEKMIKISHLAIDSTESL